MELSVSIYLFLIGKPGSCQIKQTSVIYETRVNNLIFTEKPLPIVSGPLKHGRKVRFCSLQTAKGFLVAAVI